MMDRWIGHLLDKIEYTGLMDNTTIMFTSDHGFHFGEHGYFGEIARDEMIIGTARHHDEIARIPLLVYVPGLEPTQTDAFVQPPDLMPTLLDLLGVASPQGMHGESFAPVLTGGKETFRNCVFTSSPLYSPGERTKAVDDWERLIKDPLPSTITLPREWTLLYRTEDYPAELYRVSQDPAQSNRGILSNDSL